MTQQPLNQSVTCPYKTLDIVKDQSKRPCLIYQDIVFDTPTQIGFIVFRNFYCANVSIKYKSKSGSFITLVSKYQLMEQANYEDEAQDYFRLNCTKDFNSNYKRELQFTCLRFYYYQPSPNWKSFNLTNFIFYKPIVFQQREIGENSAPKNDLNQRNTDGKKGLLDEIKSDMDVRKIVSLTLRK